MRSSSSKANRWWAVNRDLGYPTMGNAIDLALFD
jgi:uncharacterized Zn-binding protein involved in type VI secretion